QGIDFLVLEYLEGQSLADRLSQSPGGLPVKEALQIGAEIASALDAAHRAGIVHRDLKPGNVMLTKAGAKLLDFGLAKAATPAVGGRALSALATTPPSVTAQGTILGTFQYMAPEQIEGLEADARTDLFAFGCMLYEMLTGRKAFEGKTRASLLGAILKDEPPPVSQVQPTASAALDRLIATCLAKHPDDRWQNARDLMRELQWVAQGPAEAGRHDSVGLATTSNRTWRPALAGPTVSAIAITAAVAGSIVWFVMRPGTAPRPVIR